MRAPRPAHALILLLITLASPLYAAQERITDFTSDITIHADGIVEVKETISVIATGDQIKRGIYREFPTTYRDRYGNNIDVRFALVDARRDGHEVEHRIEDLSNGKRIYLGDPNILIQPGSYTYAITYRTYRQIGFFADYDELYWNVTGNGWVFPIDRATARVQLPPLAALVQKAAYTGQQGATGQDFTTAQAPDGLTIFTTTRPLNAYEGLTIAVAWPKGIIPEPTDKEKFNYFWQDNKGLVLALVIYSGLLVYFTVTWIRVGRDPKKGVIIPLFTPPENLSPAGINYIAKQGALVARDVSFSAALVNMAVKGFLRINEAHDMYSIEKIGDTQTSSLSEDEQLIAQTLLSDRSKVMLERNNHTVIGAASRDLMKHLRLRFRDYFRANKRYLFPGLLISFCALAALVTYSNHSETAIFMAIWLSIWTFGVVLLTILVLACWYTVLTEKLSALPTAAFMTLFAIPFFAGEYFGLREFIRATSVSAGVLLFVIFATNALFHYLLKAPTVKGRAILDKIEGFKMYLKTAEKDRLNALHSPEMTPELFEKYLPYAIALGVENEWGEKFAHILAESHYDPRARGWYHGHKPYTALGAAGLVSALGSSLSSAVSSSSVAPGSSSGSGGGGSSGGGGGGGGGGGF